MIQSPFGPPVVDPSFFLLEQNNDIRDRVEGIGMELRAFANRMEQKENLPAQDPPAQRQAVPLEGENRQMQVEEIEKNALFGGLQKTHDFIFFEHSLYTSALCIAMIAAGLHLGKETNGSRALFYTGLGGIVHLICDHIEPERIWADGLEENPRNCFARLFLKVNRIFSRTSSGFQIRTIVPLAGALIGSIAGPLKEAPGIFQQFSGWAASFFYTPAPPPPLTLAERCEGAYAGFLLSSLATSCCRAWWRSKCDDSRAK